MHWTLGRRNYLLFRVWPPLDETCIPSRLPRIGCIVPAEMCSQLKGKICDAAEGIVQHHHRRLRSVVGWLFLELGTLDGDFLYLETNAYQFIGRWKVQSKGPAAAHRRDWKGLTISLLVIVGQGENKEKNFLDLLGAKRKDEREKSCRPTTWQNISVLTTLVNCDHLYLIGHRSKGHSIRSSVVLLHPIIIVRCDCSGVIRTNRFDSKYFVFQLQGPFNFNTIPMSLFDRYSCGVDGVITAIDSGLAWDVKLIK